MNAAVARTVHYSHFPRLLSDSPVTATARALSSPSARLDVETLRRPGELFAKVDPRVLSQPGSPSMTGSNRNRPQATLGHTESEPSPTGPSSQ